MTPEEDKRCLCVWLLYYVSNFCQFANEGAKISIQVLLHEIIFLLSLFSSSEVFAKITYILQFGANCWLQLAGLGKKKRGNCEANLLYVESDFGTTDKSFTVFFAHWGVKRDRRVKISARWVRWFDHWVTSAVEAKEQLAIILFYGFWFPCFNAINVTFDVTLRDDSSFGKLTNSCNFKKTSHFHFYW